MFMVQWLAIFLHNDIPSKLEGINPVGCMCCVEVGIRGVRMIDVKPLIDHDAHML